MQHDLKISGPAFGLRPALLQDARFIFDLRRDPEMNGFVHETSPDYGAHHAWMQEYLRRPDDYYLVVVNLASKSPQGTTALYKVNSEIGCAEWGRWLISPDSLAATESAYLTYSLAFERLQLNQVVCRTVASNRRVLSFHQACGLITVRTERDAVQIGGEWHNIVEQVMDQTMWRNLKPVLLKRCQAVAGLLERR